MNNYFTVPVASNIAESFLKNNGAPAAEEPAKEEAPVEENKSEYAPINVEEK